MHNPTDVLNCHLSMSILTLIRDVKWYVPELERPNLGGHTSGSAA